VRQGWTCHECNYRSVGSELDLVASKGRTLAIVEVKARRTWSGLAADAATLLSPKKREALKRGARRLLAARPALQSFETVRFDLALVIHDPRGPRIEYHVGVIS